MYLLPPHPPSYTPSPPQDAVTYHVSPTTGVNRDDVIFPTQLTTSTLSKKASTLIDFNLKFSSQKAVKGEAATFITFYESTRGGRKKELRHAINGSNAAARFNEAVIDARTVARLRRLSCRVQKENGALIGRSRY